MALKRVIAGLLIGVCLDLLPVFTRGTEALHDSTKNRMVFSTWDGFEVDKLASIWLIKRFIAPGAKVRLYPKGEASGKAFNLTPRTPRLVESITVQPFSPCSNTIASLTRN